MQLQGLRFRNWSLLGLKGAVSLDAQVRGSHLNLKRQPNFSSLLFQYGVVNQSPA